VYGGSSSDESGAVKFSLISSREKDVYDSGRDEMLGSFSVGAEFGDSKGGVAKGV